jgi:flagellar basal-body rod modification protein FlgD
MNASVDPTTASDVFAAYGPQVKKKTDDIQDRFLTLLVTQLNNQDPLNPMDNAEVTSQLSQISTVKGIEQLNTTLSSMIGRVQSTESLSALSAVGRAVLLPGNSIALSNGAAYGGFELGQDADSVTVTVMDSAGNVLHTAPLGEQGAGIHTFAWDGVTDSGATAVDGNYTVKIEAKAGSDKIDSAALMLGRIDGVVPNQDETSFNVAGVPMPVKLSSIRQFL